MVRLYTLINYGIPFKNYSFDFQKNHEKSLGAWKKL